MGIGTPTQRRRRSRDLPGSLLGAAGNSTDARKLTHSWPMGGKSNAEHHPSCLLPRGAAARRSPRVTAGGGRDWWVAASSAAPILRFCRFCGEGFPPGVPPAGTPPPCLFCQARSHPQLRFCFSNHLHSLCFSIQTPKISFLWLIVSCCTEARRNSTVCMFICTQTCIF